ncbi:VWA domain-containing protein [Crossiella sp. CA-258035]|uniref:VWA domain-containing protein n=1 Tax=Crossiella sp. CA-258035 TaxID=2981138 RepID=UPI0024BC2ECB|nr:VWA domain-containing protein [Crossiella sp. CA-258035]WHT22110.1 VWA domain-containing protein [Crossiella sp. CA-258035]
MFGLSLRGFTAPWWFLLAIAVAVLVVVYLLVQRRRRRYVMRFTNLELLEKVIPKRQNWVRHVPPALLGVALLLLTIALTGPTSEQRVPRNRATVMLVIDVSLSMQATDITPTRLDAAKKSAKSFTDGLTKGVNLGLISFAGSAVVLVSPTVDRKPVAEAIDTLKLGPATATGDALNAAMATIESFGKLLTGADGPPPARIVLMTDGKKTVGADPVEVAQRAGKAKIPVSAIAFGTDYGTIESEGRTTQVPADVETMKEIAEASGGDFHKADSAEQLQKVYDTLGEQIGYETKENDASRPWLMLGTLALIIAAGTSLLIGQRLP